MHILYQIAESLFSLTVGFIYALHTKNNDHQTQQQQMLFSFSV